MNSQIIDYIYNLENPIIFDKEEKFIIFPISKTGQQSLIRTLLKDRCVVRKQKGDIPLWEKMFKKYRETNKFAEVFKFSVVRNPYDKFVSAYTYLNNLNLLPEHDDFTDFIKKYMKKDQNPFLVDPHFMRQKPEIYYKDQILVDEIIRFENLNTAFRDVAEKIDCSPDLPHINKSKRKAYPMYYNDETENIIGSIYKNDLAIFNYTYSNNISK